MPASHQMPIMQMPASHLLARVALTFITIGALALYLPALVFMAIDSPLPRTHLLLSPVEEVFIWKEKVADPPEAARALAEDHHAEFVYTDESGTYYSREEFEKRLPFIYYKNMELWGLLPITLQGRTFNAQTIKAERRVLQLAPEDLPGYPLGEEIPLYPLLESAPQQARLVFPEDRYRTTPTGLAFINADTNTVDEALSQRFTNALTSAGFVFPARVVAGRHSILKPFDAGHFLVDAQGALYHLRRVQGEPWVRRTPVDPALGIRHVEVSESRARDYYGLLLDAHDRVHLLGMDNYAVTTLTTPGYAPERMEFKVVLNPLYATALYHDHTTVTGVAMDREGYTLVRQYTHTMAMGEERPAHVIARSLFPFQLRVDDAGAWTLHGPSLFSLLGCMGAVGLLLLVRRRQGSRLGSRLGAPLAEPWGLGLTALTGAYGLVAVLLVWQD